MKTLLIALLLTAGHAMAAEIYDFTLLPQSGAISGAPGATIGWGYSIHNESTSFWLVTTDLSAGGFQNATPNLLFDFPDIAPGATVTVPYNALTAAGLYQIAWDANSPSGFVNSGLFSLMAEWWNGDPQGSGQFQFAASSAAQPYTATVAGSSVPEPATIALVALPLLLFLVSGSCRGRRQREAGGSSQSD